MSKKLDPTKAVYIPRRKRKQRVWRSKKAHPETHHGDRVVSDWEAAERVSRDMLAEVAHDMKQKGLL